MAILTDSFESGFGQNYQPSAYVDPTGTPDSGLALSTAWAHHGIYSVALANWHSSVRDFINPNPTSIIHYSMYAYFDNPIVDVPFGGNAVSVGVFEMRDTAASPICILEALKLLPDPYYYWTLISFDMGHISGAHALYNRVKVADPIVGGHPYKIAVSYAFAEPSTRILQIWIDDVLKGTINEYYPYHFYANNIYLGSPKAEYNAGIASGSYIDCFAVSHEYPAIDYFSNVASLSVDATIPLIHFLMEPV